MMIIIIITITVTSCSVMPALKRTTVGNCVGAVEDKLVYQLSVDEGNRRREGDNS